MNDNKASPSHRVSLIESVSSSAKSVCIAIVVSLLLSLDVGTLFAACSDAFSLLLAAKRKSSS